MEKNENRTEQKGKYQGKKKIWALFHDGRKTRFGAYTQPTWSVVLSPLRIGTLFNETCASTSGIMLTSVKLEGPSQNVLSNIRTIILKI